MELPVDVSERVSLGERLLLVVDDELRDTLAVTLEVIVRSPDFEDILDAVADFEPVDVREEVEEPVEVLLFVEVLVTKEELVDVREVVDERVDVALLVELGV